MTTPHKACIASLPGLKRALACGALLAAAGLSCADAVVHRSELRLPARNQLRRRRALTCRWARARACMVPTALFPPLAARTDVVPWSVLTAVKTKNEKNRILPVFNLDQMALKPEGRSASRAS